MRKIMIVDDSMVLREHIEKFSASHDFEVIAKARDGSDAIAKFKHYEPDIVTMDLTMPHIDGIECIKALIGIDPDVKILVVSALSDKHTALTAISLGARGFLNKPFTEAQLVDALNKVLATK